MGSPIVSRIARTRGQLFALTGVPHPVALRAGHNRPYQDPPITTAWPCCRRAFDVRDKAKGRAALSRALCSARVKRPFVPPEELNDATA
jgi:hypothetical protein